MKRKTEPKNPYKVGDKVKLREDVLQRHARSVPAHMGYTREQFAWRDTLRRLKDTEGTVSRLFDGKHMNVDFPDGTCIGIDFTEVASTKLFRVPDFGTVGPDNAVFSTFLKTLKTTQGYPVNLMEMEVGHIARATFQSGMGTDTVTIERVQ